jgi:predicted AlkP superfamily phosphohydrolase/phosphomutase
MQERLQVDHFRGQTDWARTTAFSLPSLNSSFIRVNLRGREPEGIIAPGREYVGLLDQIEADLRELVDVRSGGPAIEKVTRTVTAYRSEPPRNLPDLSIEWKASPYFMERVSHPKGELTQTVPWYNRSSYHTFKGFMTAAGPSIAAEGCLDELSLLDFAPTFLHLMGERVPQDFSGHLVDRMIRQTGIQYAK